MQLIQFDSNQMLKAHINVDRIYITECIMRELDMPVKMVYSANEISQQFVARYKWLSADVYCALYWLRLFKYQKTNYLQLPQQFDNIRASIRKTQSVAIQFVYNSHHIGRMADPYPMRRQLKFGELITRLVVENPYNKHIPFAQDTIFVLMTINTKDGDKTLLFENEHGIDTDDTTSAVERIKNSIPVIAMLHNNSITMNQARTRLTYDFGEMVRVGCRITLNALSSSIFDNVEIGIESED